MTFSVKDFTDFLKLPPNILSAVSLATGLILFLPEKILKKMYLINFKDKFGFIIGIVFLISISILFIFLLTFVIKKIKNKIDDRKVKKGRIKYLLNADKSKTNLIKEFIKDKTHTLSLPMNDGLILELQYFGIINATGNTQLADMGYDNSVYIKYFLQPWVIGIISNNEELSKKYKV